MQLWNRHTRPKDIQATYIGRGTPWGNPFKVTEELPRGEAAAAYKKMIADKLAVGDRVTRQLVSDLAGVDHIECSCAPKPCHGDTFVEIWNNIRDLGGDVKAGIRKFVKENGYPYGPDTDGSDHINIYSKAATSLGRALTNMSAIPVEIPDHGKFPSMENYWHWLATGCQHEQFRTIGPFDAKKLSKTLTRVPRDDFQELIKQALIQRFYQGPPALIRAFVRSQKPLTHYYHYGSDATVMYTSHNWLVDFLTEYREQRRKTWYKVVIAGTRRFTDYSLLRQVIQDSMYPITEVVSGAEKSGVDALGERYAADNNLPVQRAPADWDTHGRAAGHIRNAEMAKYADAAIVICVNQSPGSMNMIQQMKKLGKPVHEHHITM